MQVIITVNKNILNKVIIKNWTDFVSSHLYCIVLDIKKWNSASGKYLRKSRVVNLYDNKIGNEYVW